MISRSLCAAAGATALLLAACQSVHTQNAPTPPSPTPPSLEQPVSLSLGAPDTPAAPPTPVPSPAAAPAKITYSLVPGVGKTIALTFDDGPSPKLTPQLLDILKARGIHATFFLVGQNAAQYPDIVRREVAEGHEVGNHSWSHPQLTKLSADGVASQIEKTNAAIKAATGHNPTLMRPPYGALNRALDHRLNNEWGLKIILWEVDPLDWKYRNSAHVQREILRQVKPGAIVLSHDIHATTVAAMPATIDALIAQGYKFATVSELIAMGNSQPAPAPAPPTPPVVPAAPAPPSNPAEITPPPAVENHAPSDATTDGNATR